MRFGGLDVAAMRRQDEDCVTGVSSLANEEPLGVMESGVNVVWDVVGQDRHDGGNGVVREGKTALCCGRYRGTG